MTIYSLDVLLSRFGTSLLFMSSSSCYFLTCIQVFQEAGSLSEFFTVHCDPHKGFGVVNKAEADVFLEFSYFLYEPTNVGNLISGSSAFAESTLYLWKFLGHALLNPSLKDFEYNLTSMWNEDSCLVAWTFFSTALLLGLGWKLIFSSPVITAEFSKFAGILTAVF